MHCSKRLISRLLPAASFSSSGGGVISRTRFGGQRLYGLKWSSSPASLVSAQLRLFSTDKVVCAAEQLTKPEANAKVGSGSGSSSGSTSTEEDHQKGHASGSGFPTPVGQGEGADADNDNDNDAENVTLRLSPEEAQELTDGDEELHRKIKFIQMEHELARQDGARVPAKKVKMKFWKELLALRSRHQRLKYFEYLWRIEIKNENEDRKKADAREKRLAEMALTPRPSYDEDPQGMTYGLTRNTLFLRLYDTKVNSFYHHRVASAMVLGQPLILDCGYDEHMTAKEAKNCAAQVEYLLTDNRTNPKQPMNIHMCNVDRHSKFIEQLLSRIPTLFDDSYALNVSEKSYLDLFPKERLVYLSPHARDELMTFDDDDIYIIGAMVDKSDPRPFSLAKAKREGLRMKKLPLDRYIDWNTGGGKSLTINQMGLIMFDFYNTRDWPTALKHVPTRKIKRDDESSNPSDRFLLQKNRKEKYSSVLSDFELVNSRRSFGFKGGSGNSNRVSRPYQQDSSEGDRDRDRDRDRGRDRDRDRTKSNFKTKSLFNDDN